MHILLTNDDGVAAPGLQAARQALAGLGRVTVLAPDRNWSASGHAKTLHRPLRVWDTLLLDGTPALATDGAPSDCVALVALGLLDQPVDLVVSGINPHANLGHDVTYSGTVTAAMEAVIAGLPGIAVSLDTPDDRSLPIDFEPAARVAASLARQIFDRGFPPGILLNVNVPYLPVETMAGVQITRQGLRVYRDALVRRDDPRQRPYYWIGGETPTGVAEPGTDFWAVKGGFVSITPLHLDLTAHEAVSPIQGWDLHL